MTGTTHPHPHPAEHRKMPHGHHPHGKHPHGPGEDGHHHVVTVNPPPPGPMPMTPPSPTIEIGPDDTIENVMAAAGPNEVFLISDPEKVHFMPRPVVPKPGQKVVLQATISGGKSTSDAFQAKNKGVLGFGVFGDPESPGLIRDFTDQAVHMWKDTILSNFRISDVKGNGAGGGFEGHRETPAIVEFMIARRCGDAEFLGHDAGAFKFARTGDIIGPTIRYNDIEDIIGNGVWFDVQSCSAQVIGNKITGVTRKGVHWEKSGASDEYPQGFYREGLLTVEDNDVMDSGLEQPTRRYDGAFTLVSSMNAHYRRNTAQGSRVAGFLYRQDGRLSGDKHGWRAENVIAFADNNFDSTKGCDIPGVTCL